MDWPALNRIAREEWRYWSRSRLGLAACAVALLLIVTSLVTTSVRIDAERDAREQLQLKAEETFRDQPARHPHRMVHYGHYVFRTPAPLAKADPGIDAYTGTVTFLEGHKQNSATFSPTYIQPQAGPYATLYPALTYQLLVPLLLIIVGFASISREREAGTDRLVLTMAVHPGTLWLGKSLALGVLALATLLPLAVISAQAWVQGESGLVTVMFWLGYAMYLLCWVFIITAASAWTKRAASSLLMLLACWVTLSILMPRLASSAAEAWAPLTGKVQNDLAIAEELREVGGDGHNANDPAFAKLRAQLLTQYDVDSVDALPINFRGVVAEVAEADLTLVLNRYAEERMDQELAQARIASAFSLLSPFLSLKYYSTTTANTDLDQHHKYLREAEALRFSFVQRLNRLHTEELAYTDDINRSVDAESEQRTRVDARNWRLLDDFIWKPASVADRLNKAGPFALVLLIWLIAAAFVGWKGANRAVWRADG